MRSFNYQDLTSIRLESSNALILEYTEPDQGGTRLLHRFRIGANKEIEMGSGYSSDDIESTTKRVMPEEVPPRVWNDALNWIDQQLVCGPAEELGQKLAYFKCLIVEQMR